MPKFTAHVAMHDETGKLFQFAPGDIAPNWVRSRVGDHVLDKPFGKSSGRTAAKTNQKPDPKKEPEKEEDNSTEENENEGNEDGAGEVDFTGDDDSDEKK